MSRSVKIVEIVNGRESLGGGSLSFLEVGLRRTPERVCAWAGSSGQGNFELAANSDYNSRGSADPRESLRKRRISKLTLSAHTVLPAGAKQGAAAVR